RELGHTALSVRPGLSAALSDVAFGTPGGRPRWGDPTRSGGFAHGVGRATAALLGPACCAGRWHVGAEGTCPRFPRWFNFEPSRMGYPRGLGAVPLPAFAAAVDDLRPVRGRRCVTPEARDGSISKHLAGPRISAAPGRGHDEPVGGGRASADRVSARGAGTRRTG